MHDRLSTQELAGLRLLLRDDLTFSLQNFGGVPCYVVEDSINATFFRIGLVEYAFISLLNGQMTVSEVLAKTAVAMGRDAITEQEASVICRWLTDNRLAMTVDSLHGRRLSDAEQRTAVSGWRKWSNPLSMSLKLGNPSWLLHRLAPVTKWIFGPVGWVAWIGVLLIAGIRILADGRSLLHEVSPAISPENWFWLGASWLGLKLVHELAHGVCCIRYGGAVTSWGLNFVLFAPLPFVDASSAWRLSSRWQRIHVAFAGVFAELMVAGIATILRSFSTDEITRTQCLNVMLTGGVLTLLFNLNPLSRFDGYYILCDLLNMPNLGSTAQRSVVQVLKRIFFGVRSTSAASFVGRVGLLGYGLSSAAWRISVTITMLFAAEKLFYGAGAVLAIVAAMFWLGTPVLQFARYVIRGDVTDRPSRLRFAMVTTMIVCIGGWLGRTVTWPETLEMAAVVDFVPAEVVRSKVPGFVQTVFVKPGEYVRSGDVLIRLSNPEIDYEVAELSLEVARSRLRQQYFQSTGDIVARQTEDASLQSLEQQLAEKTLMQSQLEIRAPIDGTVMAADFENLAGQFLAPGAEVCTVGNEQQKQIRVVINQRDLEKVEAYRGKQVQIRFPGDLSKSADGVLTSLDPQASSQLIHPALASVTGGPLAVQVATASNSSADNPANREAQWLLTNPCFTGYVTIPESLRRECGAGQLAWVSLTTNSSSISERVWRSFRQYLDENFRSENLGAIWQRSR